MSEERFLDEMLKQRFPSYETLPDDMKFFFRTLIHDLLLMIANIKELQYDLEILKGKVEKMSENINELAIIIMKIRSEKGDG
jgi:hypothetical protein